MMAEICVVYLSEDEAIAERLVILLRKNWDVWWARDIAHGDWEEAVRAEIGVSSAVVPVLSQHAKGKRKTIIKDEMRFAQKAGKPIFPFLVGAADVPFGFGDLNHTEAHDWTCDETHEGYLQLKSKIAATISGRPKRNNGLDRQRVLTVREKTLQLPAFVFSLSSHETQVMPKDGATLLHEFDSGAALVSAYDVWKYYRRDSDFRSSMKKIHQSESVLFLDSGNYEAYRKSDRYSLKKNSTGWHKDDYRKIAGRFSPDLAFSFDNIDPIGKPDRIVEQITASFRSDDRALGERDFPLCPIVHIPREYEGSLAGCAAQIVSHVAKALDPLMLAIPERELGDGLLERARTVRDIRKALNGLGKYYPLHLLGTGNPLSMIALAAAGADSFDGLEWCRTVADYSNGCLFHFQQFEFFSQAHLNRIQDQRVRHLIESPGTPYSIQTLSYNVDFFKGWTRTMQSMIHSGQTEHLLKMVPNIGSQLFKDLSE